MSLNELFSILFGHIYSVVVVVGIVLAMLNKVFKGAADRQRGSRMPEFGGGEMNPLPRRSVAGRSVQQRRSGYPEPSVQDPARSNGRTDALDVGDSGNSREWAAPVLQPVPDSLAAPTSANAANRDRLQWQPAPEYALSSVSTANEHDGDKRTALAASHLREDDLRKAVLWSEILGPPRSKRPYRR